MKYTERHIIRGEQKSKKNSALFKNSLLFFNHIVAIALLLAYLAPYVSPQKFWPLAFFGLTYPFWLVFNLAFVCIWFVKTPKLSLYSLIVILSGWSQLVAFVQIDDSGSVEKAKDDIKIMSYNVKLFDLYNWNRNTETRNDFFNLIKNESPDIMCLQEFYTSDAKENKLNNLDTLLKLQKAKHVFTEYTTTLRATDHWGGAIFSVYPIIAKGIIKFDVKHNNLCMYVDIKKNNDTLRIYNLHLQSISFDKKDYKFLDDVMNNVETEEFDKSKNILKRLKNAYVKRAEQSEKVAAHIAKSPYPVVVCGDFNDTPASYTYHIISKKLNDAFVESGHGLGRTYIGKFPSFRIDFILHSDKYTAHNYTTIDKRLSDHHAIYCYLKKVEQLVE